MTEQYQTVYEGGVGEITKKKSRFIATVRPVETEEAALAFIEEMRKKYWDARHNCWAYVLGGQQEMLLCSDAGEPSQTAGKPMLDVLVGEGLTNVTVVVTRYFGGVLLGTGGLVRAYQAAARAGLENSVKITKYWGTKLEIGTDYGGIGKLQYFFGQRGIPLLDAVYTDSVSFTVLVPAAKVPEITKAITEATSGQAGIREGDSLYYALRDGEYLLF
ncbi:MAG: YigZ family protein [Lachnospiraceae bacterium]|nr:YigZ family protein [Lachnospiraceae bacterium]